MRSPLTAASAALAIALSLCGAAGAADPEFEALRAAARKHEAESARAPRPAATAPVRKPVGPSLAKFVPAAPKGWKLQNNPSDDAEGLVDLTRQASGRYVPTGGGGQSLEITILAKSDLIGGGVPRLGKDAYSGTEISEVAIGGQKGYIAWQTSTRSGQLTFDVGRYQIIVAGRQVTPALLGQLAASIDQAQLKGA